MCDLHTELEIKTYEHEQNEEFIMQDNIQNITCQYSNHSTSADKLCLVWCQIEALDGRNCVDCPDVYSQDVNHQLLCDLWSQIVHVNSSDSALTTASPQHVACPYETSLSTSNTLCQLWCELQSYSGSDCCPNR